MQLYEKDGTEFMQDDPWGSAYRTYMRVLAVVGYSWLVVSGVHILQRGSSDGVSLMGLGMYMGLSASFLSYGLMLNDPVLITGSTVSLMCNLFVIVCIFIVNYPAWEKE